MFSHGEIGRGQHVQDHPVHAGLLEGVEDIGHVADAEVPRGVAPAEPQVHVRRGDLGEVLPPLHGDQAPALADGVEQRHRQGAGPGPRLDHCGAGEHVPHVGDDARVLGVDDGGAARHRHHVVGPQGPQDLELAALLGGDDLPVGAPDDVVVVESPAVRLEPPALDQDDLVVAALGVAHLDAVAVRERPSAAGLAEGCPGPSRISLSVHRVKSIAWGPGRHCGAAHARAAQYSRRWLH